MNENLPIVGITIGDVAGIGPEVVVKALKRADIYELCRPARHWRRAHLRRSQVRGGVRSSADCLRLWQMRSIEFGTITLLDMPTVNPADVEIGKISALAGDAAVQYVLKATKLAMAGEIDAIATAPLNKEAMQSAGHHYIGHTEILADVTETPDCTTMLATPGLRVTHVTRHVPFKTISEKLTLDSVLLTTVITYEGMLDLGYEHPRIAVAGLNPHNGEGGILGTRGNRCHRAGGEGRAGQGHRRVWPDSGGLGLLPGDSRRLRRGGLYVPRPGPYRGEDARLRALHHHHAGVAPRAHLRRSRHRVRHRRARHRPRGQYGRGDRRGGADCDAAEGEVGGGLTDR